MAAWSILALLVAWPPVHIHLARKYHFSTWRYGGLGMYATPSSGNRDVYVFVQDCQADRGSEPAQGLASRSRARLFYRVRAGQLDPLSFPELTREESRALSRLLHDVRALSRAADFERLGRWVDARIATAGAAPPSLAILVTDPHIDTNAGWVYAEALGFVRERGRWSPLAPQRGPAALSEIMTRLEICR
jgi:hypothetical protein